MNGISRKMPGAAWRHSGKTEISADAIFVVVAGSGREFRFTELNAAAERALGMPVMMLRQFRFDGDGAKESPGSQKIPAGVVGHFQRCLETAQPVDFNGDINLQPDGADRVFRVNLIPLAEDGAVTHIIGFAREVDERGERADM
jgi:PAS domain-containing protein